MIRPAVVFSFIMCVTGCAVVKQAKNDMDQEFRGFQDEFARVFLKKEPTP